MKKLLLLFVSLLCLAGCAPRETTHWPFYVATKDGRAIYLLGTIHIGMSQFDELPDSIVTQLRSTTALAIETLEPMASPNRLNKTGHIADYLDAKNLHSLKRAAKRKKTPWKAIDRMTPEAAYLELATSNQGNGTDSVDIVVHAAWAQTGELLGLESGRERLQIYKQKIDEDLKNGKNIYEDFLVPQSKIDKATQQLIDEYKSGKLKAMNRPTTIKRNHLWLPRLIRYNKQHEALFVSVGAGHLVGKDNLLTLLKQNGYKVTKLEA